MPPLDAAAAREWIRRWDRQQESGLPDREDRFTALIDAVQAGAGREDPLIIDLGCGPGSLSVRLLDRMPAASVVAIDADPVMLALARTAYGGRAGLRFVAVDLRHPGWAARLRLERQADAAISTTALHWLRPEALRAAYAELAGLLRPGGLLLNGDHLALDEKASPVLAALERALLEAEDRRRFPGGHAETWSGWWDAVAADPALAEQVAEREAWREHADHHGTASGLLVTHLDALRAAGFAETGTLWQRGENRLLCAVR